MKTPGSGVLFAILAACGGASSSSSSPPPATPEPAAAPAAATCEGTVAKMMAMSGDEMFGQMPADKQGKWKGKFSELMITACREDGWPQSVLDCADAAPDSAALDTCGQGLGAAEQEKMMARMQPMMAELMADMDVPAPAEEPAAEPAEEPAEPSYDIEAAAAWTSGPTSVAACDAYLAVFEGYMACDKVPRQAVDASRNAIAAMKESWAELRRPEGPAEVRRAAGASCATAIDALQQSSAALGCVPTLPPPPALIAAPAAPGPKAKGKKAKAKAKAKKAN